MEKEREREREIYKDVAHVGVPTCSSNKSELGCRTAFMFSIGNVSVGPAPQVARRLQFLQFRRRSVGFRSL